MNKDEMKMIKEMAEMLIDAQDKCELNPCNECEHQGCREGCWHYLSATELYKKGGRIVADDEIVIKKRQYEQLKKYNRDRKRLRLKWQQAKQEVKDTKKKTKQETAREILQELKEMFGTSREFNWIGAGMGGIGDKISDRIEQFAKEKGIELED